MSSKPSHNVLEEISPTLEVNFFFPIDKLYDWIWALFIRGFEILRRKM